MIRSARTEAPLFYGADEFASKGLTFYDLLSRLEIDWSSLFSGFRFVFSQGMGRPTDHVVYGKCFLVGYFENIDRETDLAARVNDSLSIRRFLFGSLSGSTPDHSSLSRVRRAIAERCDLDLVLQATVSLLRDRGMVGGEAVAMDTSLVPSRARMCFEEPAAPLGLADFEVEPIPRSGKVVPAADTSSEVDLDSDVAQEPSKPEKEQFEKDSGDEDSCLELSEISGVSKKPAPKKEKPQRRSVPSSYDCEADVAGKRSYKPQPSYKIGVAADYKERVILAADAYPASMGEGNAMRLLWSNLVRTSGLTPKKAVADSGMDDATFHALVEFFGATAVTALQKNTSAASGFGKERFYYDQERDLYICPAGQELKRKHGPDALRITYLASAPTCKECPLKIACYGSRTTTKTIERTFDESSRDRVVAAGKDPEHRKLLAYRKAIVEPVFAEFKEHGGLCKIWTKGLACAQMKAKMAAAGWNIKILLRKTKNGVPAEPKQPRKQGSQTTLPRPDTASTSSNNGFTTFKSGRAAVFACLKRFQSPILAAICST